MEVNFSLYLARKSIEVIKMSNLYDVKYVN